MQIKKIKRNLDERLIYAIPIRIPLIKYENINQTSRNNTKYSIETHENGKDTYFKQSMLDVY